MIDSNWYMQPNRAKSFMLAKRLLPEFICDAVNLEGINYTLPEIQTLLDGITVGGHKVSDQQVALNQHQAWVLLFQLIEEDKFAVTAEIACALHAVAAKDDALERGKFRSGGGTAYMPPSADKPDIYDQAIFIFLTMARHQFFYDVNKRMGRFMMNGLLLQNGFPAINLSAKRQLEFNQLMLTFYDSGDQRQMNAFLRSCLDERVIQIMKE